MPSPNDNFQVKDAFDLTFKVRAKDTSVAQDGSLQNVRHLATPYPVDYGVGGCFHLTSKSGAMAAGLAANAPIYAFRWTSSTMLGIVRRVRISAWTLGAGFAAGIATFDMYRAMSWTVADTGGVIDTLGLDNGNLRTAMPSTVLSEIRHSSTAALTAGTRALDGQPTDFLFGVAPTSAFSQFIHPGIAGPLFNKAGASDHPLVLVQNEGFVIQATVPATGTWSFAITSEWDEVPLVNY
jgi:hypothetical protein